MKADPRHRAAPVGPASSGHVLHARKTAHQALVIPAQAGIQCASRHCRKLMRGLQNLLRGPMAALRGARSLAYLLDMSRSLRSVRLALGPLATVFQTPLMVDPALRRDDEHRWPAATA
jgi:hypothetical protein